MNAVFINDIGILNSQGEGKTSALSSVLEGRRTLTPKTINGIKYSLALCSVKSGEGRLLSILDRCCREISSTVHQITKKYGPERIAVILGSTDNGSERSRAAHEEFLKNGSFPDNYSLAYQNADFPVHYVKQYFQLNSIAAAVSTACTSSASAVLAARDLIQTGIVDAAVAGGVDIVSETVLRGFISLEAVDPSPCIPFSKNRKGINLGEGAALMVLTKESIGEDSILLAGCGESSDAYHMTAPDPEGKGAVQAMKKALKDSGLSTVDYINLHGTGTALNDSMEAKATNACFPDKPFASSTKPVTGHCLGAAGAMELGICWLLLSSYNTKRRLPPHIWDGERDCSFPELNLVSLNDVSPGAIKSCMSNSYAFGGSNVSMILTRGKS